MRLRHFKLPFASMALAAIGVGAAVWMGVALAGRENASAYRNYTGSQSCRDCHPTQHQSWANTGHAWAERNLADSDRPAFAPQRKIQHASQTSEVQTRLNKSQIVTLGPDGQRQAFTIDRVIGRQPLRQFLSPAADGRWQAHELAYDPLNDEWFNVYGEEDRQPGEYGHWTGRGMNWNSRCASCHNTAVQKNYDPVSDAYETAMAERGVGCEACHGPLQDHVTWRKAHPDKKESEPSPPRMSRSLTMETCASCHARRMELTGRFVPGESFYDHYSLEILGETPRWHPDGQIKDEVYEFASFMASRMHTAGVHCRDCHRADSGTGNALCLRCHAGGNPAFPTAPVISPLAHSHHQPVSSGNECIGCHMPSLVMMQRHARHDHLFHVPDPVLTRDLGVPNACSQCHTNQTLEWSLNWVDKWYGTRMDRPSRGHARLMASAISGEASARTPLLNLLKNSSGPPYWRASAAVLLARMPSDHEIRQALIHSSTDPHPLVREKAIKALEMLLDGHAPEILPALRARLVDSSRSVRIAAAWALRSQIDLGHPATKEVLAYLDLHADQPAGQYRLAMFALARGNPKAAIEHLDKAIAWDPRSPVFPQAKAAIQNP